MAEQAEHKPDMDDQVLWDGHWHMLCLQCRRVRPTRSKYCRVSERCVSRFDHYCPWIGNAVGERNHRDFVIFLCLETMAMAVSFLTAVGRLLALRQSLRVLMETHMVVVVFCVFDGVLLLSVFALTCSQLTQVLHSPPCRRVVPQLFVVALQRLLKRVVVVGVSAPPPGVPKHHHQRDDELAPVQVSARGGRHVRQPV